MIIEGLQYGVGELYGRTKPRGVRNDFFLHFLKRLGVQWCTVHGGTGEYC